MMGEHSTGYRLMRGDRSAENRQIQNAINTFNGFIDIMYEEKKLPRSFAKSLLYKLVLIAYLFVNFVHSIVARVVQRDQLVYYCLYVIGFAFELIVTIIVATRRCMNRNSDRGTQGDDVEGETQRDDEQVEDRHKQKRVFIDYVASSVGEFLIYPTLICVMYGFINERSWQFDNGISGYNLIFLAYSVIMDALYMKFYVIFLVKRVVMPEEENRRIFTPIYLMTLLATGMALTHWFMTGIIGVRIYIDNFTMGQYKQHYTKHRRLQGSTIHWIYDSMCHSFTNTFLDYLHHNQQGMVL